MDSGLDSPLYLPYRALASTVSSMVISQGEAQRLIEILSDKAGIKQDTWHMVRPVAWDGRYVSLGVERGDMKSLWGLGEDIMHDIVV